MEKEDRGQGTYSMLHNYQTPVDRQGHVKEKQNSSTSTSEVLLLTTDTFYVMSEVALGAKAVERAWRTEIKRAEFSVAREARRARFWSITGKKQSIFDTSGLSAELDSDLLQA